MGSTHHCKGRILPCNSCSLNFLVWKLMEENGFSGLNVSSLYSQGVHCCWKGVFTWVAHTWGNYVHSSDGTRKYGSLLVSCCSVAASTLCYSTLQIPISFTSTEVKEMVFCVQIYLSHKRATHHSLLIFHTNSCFGGLIWGSKSSQQWGMGRGG